MIEYHEDCIILKPNYILDFFELILYSFILGSLFGYICDGNWFLCILFTCLFILWDIYSDKLPKRHEKIVIDIDGIKVNHIKNLITGKYVNRLELNWTDIKEIKIPGTRYRGRILSIKLKNGRVYEKDNFVYYHGYKKMENAFNEYSPFEINFEDESFKIEFRNQKPKKRKSKRRY